MTIYLGVPTLQQIINYALIVITTGCFPKSPKIINDGLKFYGIHPQIKKMIRKSYTLPYFGLRFSPFFERQKQPRLRQRRITVDGIEIGKGLLKLTIISATRLPIIVKDSKLYVSITLGEFKYLS